MLLLVAAVVQPMVEMMVVNYHLNLLLMQLDLVVMNLFLNELLVMVLLMMINNHLLLLLLLDLINFLLMGFVWKKFVVVVVAAVLMLVKHLNMLVKFLMKTLNFY